MASFGRPFQQIEAKEAIIFSAGNTFYKVPIQRQHSTNLLVALLMLEGPQFIQLKNDPVTGGFRYTKIPYGPLKHREVIVCLNDFIKQVYNALTLLHSRGLCHMDLRLENICFNDQYQATLIDFDRSCITEFDMQYYDSCMYDVTLNAVQHDWRQLACLIMGVLTKVRPEQYHSQELEMITLPAIKESPFISQLWNGKLSLFQ